ncbi:hypothetical protein EPUL_004465, partial [Erysiphe pulchra]
MSKNTFPTYQICEKFDDSKPAGRWLQQLQCDLEPYYADITPDIFFNAITILFTDKAEDWLDSSPQFTKFLHLEEKPKLSDVEEFKFAFKRQFLRKKVENFKAIKIEVSLMDLLQISPDLSKAFRSLSTRVNKLSEKINGPKTKPAFSTWPTDENSNYQGIGGMTMNVANGTSAQLTHYASFELGVLGIWRKVEAFVRPFNNDNGRDIHLLLGMPWLHAVDARTRIRDSIIEIGDSAIGEEIMKIKGPKFIKSEKQKL